MHHYALQPAVCKGFSFSYHSQHVIISLFNVSHSIVCEQYLNVALICICLMTKDVDQLLLCLLVICVSSLEKYVFRLFAHFEIVLFIFSLLICKFFGYTSLIRCLYENIFCSVNCFSFSWYHQKHKKFHLDEIQFIYYFI